MLKKFTTLNKLHNEIDPVFILKDIFHVDKERVINLIKHFLLIHDLIHLMVLKYHVFADAFHGVELSSFDILNHYHLAE